ncbi:hypothetical protein CRM22_001583 [Opisthorchis felineus]|uniref:DUF4201 domain-containing protein n=1 Tax=Opisthorchis felineus TaxID=147828 RepID=A0A4S2MA02_OPIFE|nr:hypothetical protein CRM22_001583 [Opisthorchis felineus]
MALVGTRKKFPLGGDIHSMSLTEIKSNVTSINSMATSLKFENFMYQRQVVKLGLDSEVDQALALVTSGQHTIRIRRTSGTLEQTRYVRLNGEYKCMIAREYLDEMARDSAETNRICESIVSNYKITMEDLDLSMKYLKKQRHRLQQRVVPLLQHREKTMEAHHAFMHFYNIVLKDMDAVTEKLRITNKNLLKRLDSIRQFLKERARSNIMIQAVDFEEQRIRVVQASMRMLELKNLIAVRKAVAARLTLNLEKLKSTLSKELCASQKMNKRLFMTSVHNKHLSSAIEQYREELGRENNEVRANERRHAKNAYEQHRRLWSSTKRGL